MKIFRSAIFWIFLSAAIIAAALFFLLPVFGLKDSLARLLWTLLPLVLAGLVALIISIFRLKKALKSQETPAVNPFEADLSLKPWIEPLKAETKAALDILRQSGKGKVRVGQNPLDIYKFYLVFGNSGSGRTSLLEHSGIHFPRRYPSAAELAKQTQHFTQWWFSNQGIFLEPPPRYASGEEGDDELQQWLTLLNKEGKTTALDGLVLVVSLRELLDGGLSVQDLASRFRDKIALAMSTLKLELPIYLAFTHADLLPGFKEYFENMQEPESHQVFGATFALRGNLAPARARFEREYKKLFDSLQTRIAGRLAQLTDPARKKQIFLFPNEFGAAQERLALFVEHLFKDTMRRERAMFRGFFLTSVAAADGASSAAAVDPFADAQDQAHFLDHRAKQRGGASAPKAEAFAKPRALFTYLLFGGVLKNDKSLSQIPGYRLGSLSRRALITSGVLAFLALAVGVYALTGFFKSRSYLGRMATIISEAGKLRWRSTADFREEYPVMDKLLAGIKQIKDGNGPSMPPGFSHSGEVLELAGAVHSAQMNRMAAVDAFRNLSATLDMSSKYSNPTEHGKLHDNLRLYLLLTLEGKPHLKDTKPAELAALLAPLWSQEASHKFGAENLPANLETSMEDHAAFYAERYVDGELPALDKGDPNIIANARQALMGSPSIDALYSSIEASEDPSGDLTLADMGVPAEGALKSSAKIPAFYTKKAFDEDAMDRLAKGAEEPHQHDWVLGEGAVAALPPEMQDQRQLYRALVDKYYQEYFNVWSAFLQSLSVRLPTEPGAAAGKLSGYASTTQGLQAVLGRLLVEVNLLAPPTAGEQAAEGAVANKLGKAGGLVGMALAERDADKKKLKEKFRFVEELNGVQPGSGLLQDYFTAVKGLSDVLNKLALNGGSDGSDAMEAAKELFGGKSDSPINQSWNEANKIRSRYETQTWIPPLLETPVREVANYLSAAAAGQLEAAYKGKVAAYFNQNLRGRYPIAKTGTQEVNMEDFKAFFAPDKGVFPAFFTGKLQPFVKVEEDGLSPKNWNGTRLLLDRTALANMFRALQVSKRMYAEGATAPRVYDLSISLLESRNTAKVTFRLGEDKIAVKPGEGQQRMTFRWPNENSYKGAELLVDNVGGGSQGRRVDGVWGFLRLLDAARALNVRTGGLTAKWRFNVAQKYDVDVALEANIPDRENPFTFPDYYKFDLSPTLMADGDNRVSAAATP